MLLAYGLGALLGGCDPLPDTGVDTEDLRPRAAKDIPCGYAYPDSELDGVPTTLAQTSSRAALPGEIESVALAPGCSVSIYDLEGDVLLRGEESHATYDALSTTAAEYTCSCAAGTTTPVAEAVRQSSRLPLWEGIHVDLREVPGRWFRTVDTIHFPSGEGSVMASLGPDGHGSDLAAIIIAEQGRDGVVDLATGYSTGFCALADCACTPTDDLSCSTKLDISSSIETLTAFRTN